MHVRYRIERTTVIQPGAAPAHGDDETRAITHESDPEDPHADQSEIPAPVGRHCGGSTCRDTRSPRQSEIERRRRSRQSVYGFQETIERLKKDIGTKGIKFFSEIDQSKLAADAGVKLNPSTLLVFGNPPLGTQFMTANPNAGLDWPVRLLVIQDSAGAVWTVYTDFAWIAARHGIVNRGDQFKMASMVIASITSSVKA